MPDTGQANVAPPKVYAAFTGNCQSMFFASAAGTIPGFEAGCFGKEVRYNPVEDYSAETYTWEALIPTLAEKKQQGYRVILCEQTWYRFPLIDLAPLDGIVDDVVRFPFVHNYGLWPQAAVVDRVGPVKGGVRMLRADQDILKANDAMADVKMLDFFNERFREEVLYDTPFHPSPLMLAEITRRIAKSAAFSAVGVDAEAVADRVARSRGINTVFNHPVNAELAEIHGCKWAAMPSYRAYRACAQAIADRDFVLAKYLLEAFVADDNPEEAFFRRMIMPFVLWHLAGTRDVTTEIEGADALREKVISLDPNNVSWYLRYAKILLDRAELARSREVLDTALKVNGRHPALHQLSADVALAMDDPEAALSHLESARRWMSAGRAQEPLLVRINELRARLGRPLLAVEPTAA